MKSSPILAMLVAGSLSQLGAWHPTVERGGRFDECIRRALSGEAITPAFRLRCEWHRRRWIDQRVRLR